MLTLSLSPDFMNRSVPSFGVKVSRVDCSWFAGPCATPFRVTNANWNVSIPTLAAHVGFCSVPFTGSSSRLNTFIAAHHLVGLQVSAPMATAHVGHGHPARWVELQLEEGRAGVLGDTAGRRCCCHCRAARRDLLG
jgi:hypothetical protein